MGRIPERQISPTERGIYEPPKCSCKSTSFVVLVRCKGEGENGETCGAQFYVAVEGDRYGVWSFAGDPECHCGSNEFDLDFDQVQCQRCARPAPEFRRDLGLWW